MILLLSNLSTPRFFGVGSGGDIRSKRCLTVKDSTLIQLSYWFYYCQIFPLLDFERIRCQCRVKKALYCQGFHSNTSKPLILLLLNLSTPRFLSELGASAESKKALYCQGFHFNTLKSLILLLSNLSTPQFLSEHGCQY